ncbi:SAM-dependent methyltransferase [Candidatus Protochlamydia phocaeensis]|uniref:SAM-dependent methyltransferase n=1 Tax=Candidatus Protochlamydia phocaeensis TaxID=1414722 RepID=UPI0008388D4D|nr:SAM-dependent methyltransferase [Candidatus Protochlamydia phocaeensis]
MSEKPTLLLLPNLLGDHRYAEIFLPASVAKAVQTLDGLIAESEGEGRRYLKRFATKKPANEIPIALFNEHTPDADIDFLLEPIIKGERWGIVSDAGLPCIADPGSKLVHRARQRGLAIQAFVGPSSILMALMLSGLPGQKFFFHGYLAKEADKRQAEIKHLLQLAGQDKATQIFMEAPYRNMQALDSLLKILPDKAWLAVAWDLTMPTQGVISQTVESWKKCTLPSLEKKPAIFLFHLE